MAFVLVPTCHAAPPVVTNVRASQVQSPLSAKDRMVEIRYDLQDADSATVRVSLLVSEDGGGTWNVPAQSLSGFGFGAGVTPGSARYILWNAPADWPGRQSSLVRFRIVVNDDPIPAGMALIPAGNFQMGNSMDPAEGSTSELPVHTVYVSAFYMDRSEVTKQLWDEVRNWGLTRGYTDLPEGSVSGVTNYSKGPTHPVFYVNWYAMVKWCNARSQKEGLMPVYFTNDAQSVLYQTGNVNVTNAQVKWSANGYRLPTEAEWEKAARGGLSGKRFPWGDTISHAQANYNSLASYSYDTSPTRGYHPIYGVFPDPYTSPVGSFAPNGYGLYDMAGNIWERCWDWFGSSYYSMSPSSDPQGSPAGSERVFRGGEWNFGALGCRVATRSLVHPPGGSGISVGFRTVRR